MERKLERQNRVIAKGEHSNHSHVVIGDATIERSSNGEIIINVGNEGAVLKHILESNYIETGHEIWTGEHFDIPMEKGLYKFIQQQEYNPYNDKIQAVKD